MANLKIQQFLHKQVGYPMSEDSFVFDQIQNQNIFNIPLSDSYADFDSVAPHLNQSPIKSTDPSESRSSKKTVRVSGKQKIKNRQSCKLSPLKREWLLLYLLKSYGRQSLCFHASLCSRVRAKYEAFKQSLKMFYEQERNHNRWLKMNKLNRFRLSEFQNRILMLSPEELSQIPFNELLNQKQNRKMPRNQIVEFYRSQPSPQNPNSTKSLPTQIINTENSAVSPYIASFDAPFDLLKTSSDISDSDDDKSQYSTSFKELESKCCSVGRVLYFFLLIFLGIGMLVCVYYLRDKRLFVKLSTEIAEPGSLIYGSLNSNYQTDNLFLYEDIERVYKKYNIHEGESDDSEDSESSQTIGQLIMYPRIKMSLH